MSTNRHSAGFSLIELMIALVAGLIVSIAAVAFMVATLKSNTEYVQATKLEQELRNNLDFVTRELRRAGYDQDALAYVNLPPSSTDTSPFNQILETHPSGNTNRSCIIYAYDRLPGQPGEVDLAIGEIRAVRRVPSALTVNGVQVGVLEFAESSAGRTPDCADGGGADYTVYPPVCTPSPASGVSPWCPLSDPKVLNVTSFFVNTGSSLATSTMQIRDLRVDLTGTLIRSSDVSRTLQSSVRVRADCLRTSPGTNCIIKPSGT